MPSLAPDIVSNKTKRPNQTRRVGLALPLSVNGRGGLTKTEGHDNDIKIISLALLGTGSQNPFQQPLDNIDDVVFDLDDDVTTQAVVISRLKNAFNQFTTQHRYKLIPDSISFERQSEGDLIVNFEYHNLEADEVFAVSQNVG